MRTIRRKKLIHPELSYKINGILYAVHNELGRYCNEKQYCDAIENRFNKFQIKNKREVILPPFFEGELKGRNRVDFLVEEKVILEVKAKRFINKEDYYQVMRYLKALNKKLAIIVNFRERILKPKRIINPDAPD